VRKRGRRSAPLRFPDPEVAHVLPAEFCSVIERSGGVRQPRHHEFRLRVVSFPARAPADLSVRCAYDVPALRLSPVSINPFSPLTDLAAALGRRDLSSLD